MNKFQISITFFIIAIFVGIIVITQGSSLAKPITQVPTLPPEASTFKLLTPSPPQQQQVQGQQTVQNGSSYGPNAPQPTFGVEEGLRASYAATIKTTKGDIEVFLSGKDAPRTVKNFLEKAHGGYYNGLLFHRVEDWVVQGGDPKGDGTGGNLMATELNNLAFVRGSLGVARGADIRVSNDSQFFICKQDSPHLNQQYTNFGIVTKGMEVVDKLQVGDKILAITPVNQ